MSREKAKEILDDNMSECTSHHVQKMDHLEQWIIDAMIEYHQSQAKHNEVLDLVSKPFYCSFLENGVSLRCDKQCRLCNEGKI